MLQNRLSQVPDAPAPAAAPHPLLLPSPGAGAPATQTGRLLLATLGAVVLGGGVFLALHA